MYFFWYKKLPKENFNDDIDPSNKGAITKKDSLLLVNISKNPDELENLTEKYPEKVEELIREFYDWYGSKN